MKVHKSYAHFVLFPLVIISLLSLSVHAQSLESEIVNEVIKYSDPALQPIVEVYYQSRADLIQSMNSRIEDLNKQQKTQSGAEKEATLASIRTLAKERKNLVRELAIQAPERVKDNELPANVAQDVQAETAGDIEHQAVEQGELTIYHVDLSSEDMSRYIYILKKSNGEKLSLHFSKDMPALKTGDRVTVQGLEIGNAVAVESGDDVQKISAPLITGNAVTPVPNTFGAQKTLVIIVKFQDKPTAVYQAPAQIQSIMFNTNNTGAVTNFYNEGSYKQTSLVGDVSGPFVIPIDSTTCDYVGVSNYGKAAAQAAGYNVASYSRLVYAFPGAACGWWGLGTVGGTPSHAWINGAFDNAVSTHELGHNFGLWHSHALECGSAVLCGITNPGSYIEYGDSLDVMGYAAPPRHFNAVQKQFLGWLGYGSSPPATTVLSDGTYTIEPYETVGTKPKALMIKTPLGDWYSVEFRQNIGFDTFLSTNVLNGVVIHYWAAAQSSNSPNSVYLLDMTPATGSWFDPALTIGQSFTDSAAGITIKTISVSPTGATVAVTLGGPNCVRRAPAFTISPLSSSGYSGQSVTYSYTITNNDLNCTQSAYTLTPTLPSSWKQDIMPSFLLSSGQTQSGQFTITSALDAPAAAYTMTETLAAGAGTYSALLTYNSIGPAPYFTDNFNRPDGPLGGQWQIDKGSFILQSSQALGNGITNNIAVIPGFTGQQLTASADFTATSTLSNPRFGVVLRYINANNYYLLLRQVGTGKLTIAKVVNGIETPIQSIVYTNPALNVPFRLEGRATGQNLSLYINGKIIISALDSLYSSGTLGMYLTTPTTTFPKLDNFNATRVVQAINCTSTSPSLSISPLSQSGAPGSSLMYFLNIKDNDVNCAASTFTITPSLPTGFTQNPASLAEVLASGQSIIRNVTITSALSMLTGPYSFSEDIVNTQKISLSSIATAQYTVSVNTTNQAPFVDAGPDQTITIGQIAQLQGIASDDGLPNPPGALSLLWTMVSGPSIVAFDNPTKTNPIASFTSAGIYVLRLTADDGALKASDDVVITVQQVTGTFTDDFNRPNSLDLGSSWTDVSGDFQIINQQAKNVGAGVHRAIASNFNGVDLVASANFTSVFGSSGPSFGIIMRYQDPNNYYLLYRTVGGTSSTRISRIVNGVEKVIASMPIPNPLNGKPFKMEGKTNGNILSLYVDGVKKVGIIDSNFSSGGVGIYVRAPTSWSHIVDNFYATNAPQPLAAEPAPITGNIVQRIKVQIINVWEIISSIWS